MKPSQEDTIYFAAGSGKAHTVINPGPNRAKLLVQGEQDKEDDFLIYPLHPEREREIKRKGILLGGSPRTPTWRTQWSI